MATTTSAPSKVGNNFYKTSVTTNTDGSLSATTFRTDAKGGGAVAVSTVNTDKNANSTRTYGSGATAEEKKAFANPNSPERKAYVNQIQSQNPYGSNPTAEQKQKINSIAGKPNQAINNPNPDQQGTSTTGSQDIGTQSSGTRTSFRKDLRYPLSLRGEKQDVIQFNMLEYRPKKLSTGGGDLNPIENRATGNIIGTVTLPITNGLTETLSVNWSQDNLDPFKAMGVDIANTAIVQGIGAGVSKLGDATTAASENSEQVGTAVATAFVQAATGTQNILSRTRGAIVNENLELLFTGPTLRPFNFTFKLAPRSKEEASAVREIIRFFKQGMSPITTQGQLFLKAPHTFQVKYLHQNKDHTFLNRFKEAALLSFTVDYTPEGQYATFQDGAMVAYQINMQFQELEPIYNSDYYNNIDQNKDTNIGY